MATYKLVNADQLDSDLALVAESIRTKGGTSEQLTFPDGFKSAVDAISTGATIQRASGTVTVSGTAKTVNCGFEPDAVFFTGKDSYDNTNCTTGAAFHETNLTSLQIYFTAPSSSYLFSFFAVNQTSTGFTVSGKKVSPSFQQSAESNRSVSYIAIKYTE